MKSLWIKLILIATFAASGNSLSFAQTPTNYIRKAMKEEKRRGM
jgi:hypothetical protein